nr:MAG TPA: hypothetical protein [Caudoviricetes sp.]
MDEIRSRRQYYSRYGTIQGNRQQYMRILCGKALYRHYTNPTGGRKGQ